MITLGKLMPGEMMSKIPSQLLLPIEMRWSLISMALTRFAITCISEIKEISHMDRARKIVYDGFTDLLKIIGNNDIESVKQLLGIEGNDTVSSAKLMVAVDGILGNIEEIIDASPKKTVVRNIDCRIWENRKSLGLEERFPCVIFCYESIRALNNLINPNIVIRGKKSGSLVGIPDGSFNACRMIGDDYCEVEYTIP